MTTEGDYVQATTTEKLYLTYREAEQLTGLHETTIWRALKTGELKASGRGRGIRFARAELIRWMESR